MTWNKQPPYVGDVHQGCLDCPTPTRMAADDMIIGVGFGIATVTRDGNVVYSEHEVDDDDGYWTTADAERIAVVDPDHDWRIVKNGPLHGETYQRHGAGQWVMIESNQGFA